MVTRIFLAGCTNLSGGMLAGYHPGRYAKLNEYFLRKHEKRAQLTFAQIEKLIERPLPESAINHRAFWANDPKHSQAKAWLDAGWRVEAMSKEERTVYFVRKK